MKVTIRLSQPDALVMKVKIGDRTEWHELWLPEQIDKECLIPWLLKSSKSILPLLPLKEDQIQIIMGNVLAEKYGQEFASFAHCLDKTSLFLSDLPEPRPGNKILFVNVSEDIRYKSFYTCLAAKSDALYMNLELGFNRETRKWEKAPFMPMAEFVKYLTENRVGTLVTVNHYLGDRLAFEEFILVSAVIEKLGIRFIIIENDPASLRPWGFWKRSFYHSDKYPMFSNLHCLNHEYDVWHKNSNITPVAIPQDYRGETKPLRDDYRVVVLSNSRWESVKDAMPRIDWILGNLENPWRDLTVWYMALRRMIFRMDLKEYERLFADSMAHQIFWLAAQVLKYRAIKALKTDRRIDVYGDVGWQEVCPEYYRGSLNNDEINRLFDGDDFMVLLANCSYTYQDASGPVYDMIRSGCHFVNLPVVAKIEPLAGLEHIEYSTPDELNALVNDVKPAFEKARSSLNFYRNLLRSSVGDLMDGIIGNRKKDRLYEWGTCLRRHDDKLTEVLDDYANKNEVFLRASYRTVKLR